MDDTDRTEPHVEIVDATHRYQIRHFQEADPRCRALQLPDGIMLRYNLSQSLYFYLRTGVENGKITTRVFASDSPYDREKTAIGNVGTPMFEEDADAIHLKRVEALLYTWVNFVQDEPDTDRSFSSFPMPHRPE